MFPTTYSPHMEHGSVVLKHSRACARPRTSNAYTLLPWSDTMPRHSSGVIAGLVTTNKRLDVKFPEMQPRYSRSRTGGSYTEIELVPPQFKRASPADSFGKATCQ